MNDEEKQEITTENENVVEETTNTQEPKTFSEEEVNELLNQKDKEYEERFDEKFNRRWRKELEKQARNNSLKDEYIRMLQEQTNTKSLEELIALSENQYGIKVQSPKSTRDEERLGKLDAQEILELDEKSIEEVVKNLSSNTKRNAREEATLKELESNLSKKKAEQKRKNEIKEAGIDENVLENQEFKAFANKFNEHTSIKEIYELYNKSSKNVVTKSKPFSVGSANGNRAKIDSEYYTEEEYESLTQKDLENPKVYEKAMRTMKHFSQS